MKVLLDTNVILDLLLRRNPWVAEAEVIREASLDGRLEAYVSASTITDIYYISRRLVGRDTATQVVGRCITLLRILPIDRETIWEAYSLPFADFEDALQATAAARNQVERIVSRDAIGFGNSPVPVIPPADLVNQLRAAGPQRR
jgi:predicted nucleic acid-binding protein